MAQLQKFSGCKINLLLNILGKRPDGFHELETVMQPVPLFDVLTISGRIFPGVELTCNDPQLPCDSTNLVHKAATAFLRRINAPEGVAIHLEKKIPMAAGLGGGSGNAATTLLALNELFRFPLGIESLHEIACGLGSDVPFFLQENPGFATGRGEKVVSLNPFSSLEGATLLLVHPGFGISTPWAYGALQRFPKTLNGKPGRAQQLIKTLASENLQAASRHFYNSLEVPAFEKYPILSIYQEFFKVRGAEVSLMSGSGSTTFAIFSNHEKGEQAAALFPGQFGGCWLRLVTL